MWGKYIKRKIQLERKSLNYSEEVWIQCYSFSLRLEIQNHFTVLRWDFKSLIPSKPRPIKRIKRRIGSDSTNQRMLREFSLCSRQIYQLWQGDVNFENSNFLQIHYFQSIFISYLWSYLTLLIIPKIQNPSLLLELYLGLVDIKTGFFSGLSF